MSNRIDSTTNSTTHADYESPAEAGPAEPGLGGLDHAPPRADEAPPMRLDDDEDAFESGEAGSELDRLLFASDRYTQLAAAGSPGLSLEEARRSTSNPLDANRAVAGFADLLADPSLDLGDVRSTSDALGKDGRLDAGSLSERFAILENPEAFKKELVAAMRSRPDAAGYTAAELSEKAEVMVGKVADDVAFAFMDAVRDRALPPLREAQRRVDDLAADPAHRREALASLAAASGDVDALQRELVTLGLSTDGARELAARLAPLHLDDAARAAFEAGEAGVDTGWLPWQDGEYAEIDQSLSDGIASQREALDDLLTRLADDEADNSRLLTTPIFEKVRADVLHSEPWASHLADPASPAARVLAEAGARSSAADDLEAEQIAFLQEATKKLAPDALAEITFGTVEAVLKDHEADLAGTAHELGMTTADYVRTADAAADRIAAKLGQALAGEAMKAGGLTKDHPAVKRLADRLEELGLPEKAVGVIVDRSVTKAQGAAKTTAGALAGQIRG